MREREAVIAALAERFDRGQDIFTGEPLTGLDELNWLLVQDEQEEHEGSLIFEES